MRERSEKAAYAELAWAPALVADEDGDRAFRAETLLRAPPKKRDRNRAKRRLTAYIDAIDL
jgi:hypothetical protein